MYFDTHCHLNHDDLYKDLENNIQNAINAGVKRMLVVGYDKPTSLLAIKIANKYDFIYAAIGFHPTEIFNLQDDDYDEVMKNVNNKKVVAIGEIGLDYHWIKTPIERELQKEYFIKQIQFANDNHKPISIHCRDAIAETLEILKEFKPLYGGIMHCYSGSVELIEEFTKLGLYISLGGPVTFTNAKTPKEVAIDAPLDKLLVETDSPYLAPHPFRGSTNKPELISYVVEEIARLRKISKNKVADVTYKNACKILGISDE